MCIRDRPCGLIGISPWTDLTGSGQSYIDNRDIDPSMTPELLQFYAACYTDHPEDPLCSPLFGDLTVRPPSLLFVGGDEVMLDDTRVLHEKLLAAGCRSCLLYTSIHGIVAKAGSIAVSLAEPAVVEDEQLAAELLCRAAEAQELRFRKIEHAALPAVVDLSLIHIWASAISMVWPGREE